MASIADIRAKYPQYNDLSDEQLANAVHRKFYSDIPVAEFNSKIGLPTQPSVAGDLVKSTGQGLREGVEGIAGQFGDIPNALGGIVNKVVGYVASPEEAKQAGDAAKTGADVVSGLPTYTLRKAYDWLTGNDEPTPLASPTSADVSNTVTNTTGVAPYKPTTTAGEYARTASSFVPAAAAFGGASPSNIIKYGVLPGIASEGAGQVAQEIYPGAETYARLLAAMAAPVGVAGANKVISPFGGAISEERAALNKVMKREGIDLTAGQQTGNKALRTTEGQLGGGAAQNFAERQGEQFTGAIMKRIGSNATRATPEAVNEAGTRIGGMFDDLASRNNITIDEQFSKEVGDTLRTYVENTNPTARIPAVSNTVADITADIAKGSISGAKYKQLASTIGEKLKTATGEELEAYRGIREALDDAMERTIAVNNPADLGMWKETRNAYKNLLVVEKAVTAAGENARHGIISPAQLRSAVVAQGRRAFARGQGDFADLARAGEGTMAALPDSGAIGRIAALLPGSTTGTGAAIGGAVGSVLGMPGLGAAVGAASPHIGRIAGRAALTDVGRKYLANQVKAGSGLNRQGISAVIQAVIANMAKQ
ncbi:hypothetical protein CU102_17990 [Phyllobacterium brassicacearum]|uniref:Uncharacterized protein n=1 Tax=Phyllobacterium brassicacearum TaxID=314235 RepID=A0A2P7BJP4_9HYPH|nr:DUF1269 domain-containing protein [Phyllobacterium brassicacearum]PSH66700.1 hypothetical protein CU102_17990 [Phyllobacterium brassicacearum]TDQ32019.1 hypothetical protein DEV91_106116 [Phyllobacterium brassicacearum]